MQNQNNQADQKLCRECGTIIKEQVESTLYECEKCMGTCDHNE
ncbi:hypothetical protein KZO01_25030 [Kurthia zopfii]|uniref:YhfH family protein n=1 Tax=Kurthia zopfii TaxID=1650 RepID=A0A8B4Q8U6_9BACL|nr:YhfH family protein [Kurthia zopfii]TDR33196.1 hypothetical protein DFR61_1582 [Kurthia zopfii]GEK32194.1 hypothetical protein KZO01_25030 [Kurthia zopfii]STX08940.1 Uncharacterised protein [Kurthia zopfii]VEI04848.1 Uncharacterised protein [Kurthia zopfii]